MLSNGHESRLTQDATSEIPGPLLALTAVIPITKRLSREEFGPCSLGL